MSRPPAPLPRIAVSLGDPGGIGPEIALRAAVHPTITKVAHPILVGAKAVLQRAARITGISIDGLQLIQPPHTAASEEAYPIGVICAANGAAAYAAVCAACDLVLAGEADALCTGPISKEAIHKAGYDFPGHTELLAERCGNAPVRMMLEGGGVRVVLQTIHVPLATVSSLLTTGAILETLQMCHEWGTRYLGKTPAIAVCGFNPHAGENGKFGTEEQLIIGPAVALAQAQAIRADGPLPADTVFHRQIQDEFDIVLAMYHDQGLVAVKTVGFHEGVNLTIGLPFVRTSPDHGTAFALAGTGTAAAHSMVSAMRKAAAAFPATNYPPFTAH